jgi:cathepsin A (carboxypeptidase C)
VAIFFEHFPKFKGRAFHIAGESYGVGGSSADLYIWTSHINSHQGRYVPVFAAEVYDQNARLIEAGLTPINLQSVMIGEQGRR